MAASQAASPLLSIPWQVLPKITAAESPSPWAVRSWRGKGRALTLAVPPSPSPAPPSPPARHAPCRAQITAVIPRATGGVARRGGGPGAGGGTPRVGTSRPRPEGLSPTRQPSAGRNPSPPLRTTLGIGAAKPTQHAFSRDLSYRDRRSEGASGRTLNSSFHLWLPIVLTHHNSNTPSSLIFE